MLVKECVGLINVKNGDHTLHYKAYIPCMLASISRESTLQAATIEYCMSCDVLGTTLILVDHVLQFSPTATYPGVLNQVIWRVVVPTLRRKELSQRGRKLHCAFEGFQNVSTPFKEKLYGTNSG
ncbi:hypothetical protein C0J52_24551 [Blattella germanica]|nr:hypothetical protein C0J52_24551 [Blattella germanica]